MASDDEQLARQALGMLELFSFSHDDTEQRMLATCKRAVTPVGDVAAVCVPPRFVCLARTTLDRMRAHHVQVIAQLNFPHGGTPQGAVLAQAQAALIAGADELDVVYPFRTLLGGDRAAGTALIAACRAACGDAARLTVTVETADLRDPQWMRQVCCDAIAGGADFIKSGTGIGSAPTSAQAARIMLESIAEAGGQVGFKVAGGLRTLDDARPFIALARARFGPQWAKPARVRLNAFSLLDDVQARLGVMGATGGYGY